MIFIHLRVVLRNRWVEILKFFAIRVSISSTFNNILKARSGYTHLYNAVDYSLNTVLEEPVVKQVLSKETKPTIVLLTDGFNNEASNDTCTSNVPRLTRRSKMRKQMDGLTLDSPLIFTVGLDVRWTEDLTQKRVKPGV